MGGSWVTLFASELAVAKDLVPFVDIIIEGEGEAPFLDILKADDLNQPGDIPNAWLKNNGTFSPPVSQVCTVLDEIPPPNYDGIDLDLYSTPRPVMLQASRGCYWGKCAFCVHAAGVHNYKTKEIRIKKFEKLSEDLEILINKYKPKFLSFADVSISPAQMNNICDLLIAKNHKIPWFAFLRFEKRFDHDLLKKMREAGCFILNFGLESGSNKVLETINKGYNLETAMVVLQNALDMGFRVTIHTMAALPGEKAEDLDKTLKLIEKFSGKLHESYTEIFRLEKDTRIFSDPEHYGLELIPCKKVFNNAIPFKNKNGLSPKEAIDILNKKIYSYYIENNNLLFRRKSHFGMKHKADFSEPSIFKADFSINIKDQIFTDSITVTTTGGDIFKKLE